MKARIYLSVLVSGLIGLFSLTTSTAQATFRPDWILDAHAYEFDMSAFIALRQGQTPVNRWTEMEVAAFSKTECRGIATLQQIDSTGVFYYYLRIRSNKQQGDTIYFKCFDNVLGMEYIMPGAVVFVHLNQLGDPSSPYKLYFAQPVSGINLNVDSMTINLGEQGSLIATVLPADATNKQVLWASSDTTVAKVSATGLVSALKIGACQIRATTVDGGYSDTCRITVIKIVGLPKQEVSDVQLIGVNGQLVLKGLKAFDLIQILSLDGTLQKSFVSDESFEKISLQDLPKGCYLIRISRNQQIFSFKFIR